MESILTQPVLSVLLLVGLSLLPFAFMLATSFIKITVVFSILRSGLGTQQVPSGIVISAVAVLLSLYVMRPVGAQMRDAAAPHLASVAFNESLAGENLEKLLEAGAAALEPLRGFLHRNAGEAELELFVELSAANTVVSTAVRPDKTDDREAIEQGPERAESTDLMVAFPAFVITELSEAFQIGFVIFLPFLIIDVVVSNILLALGMHMLSPTTISLPFKLLLFVMVDGWYLLSKALVLGYA